METPIHLLTPETNRRKTKSNLQLNTSVIVAIAFGSVFFSRVLDTLGAPSIINFAHFATIPFALWVALTKTRIQNKQQQELVQTLVAGIFAFLSIILMSAILNDAGIINVVLSFLLWVEPFLLLIAILCLPNQPELIARLQKWVLCAFVFHTFLAFIQHYVLQLHHQKGLEDNIQGVFYRSGAGHVVGASVALSFGIYWLVTGKQFPLWVRGCFCAATFWHMLLSDAKQVLLSFIIAGILLLLTKLKSVVEAMKYIVTSVVLGGVFSWCIQNFEAFRAFKTWMRPEIYGPEGEATLLKTAAIRIVPTYYESGLNTLFGLGPGHTVDRLGGWMWSEYWHLFGPLGATVHPASRTVWQAVGASWLGDQSSMFSPLFGWAAIWGDFGWVGLAGFLGLWGIVYLKVCIDDISKFLMFSVLAVGVVFSQMQEPGYTVTIALLLGINWHEQKLQLAAQRREKST